MKRYFSVTTDDIFAEANGLAGWHFIDVGSHDEAHAGKYLVVVDDSLGDPPATWHELPHLLDTVSRTSDDAHAKHAQLLKAIGTPAAATGYTLAKHFATIHPLFKP